MDKSSGNRRSITLSVRIFQALLVAYPTKFRLDYGEPMIQVFRDACRRAGSQGGTAALLALWVRTILDLIKTAVEEHSHGGTHMTSEKFIKLSGWALMIGPILFLVGWLASSRPQYSPYNAAALPIDRYANLAAMPLVAAGLALISLGLVGMLLRYGSKSRAAAAWLGLGVLGALSACFGSLWMGLDTEGYGWIFFFIGLFIQFFALTLFGLTNLGLRLLPRWNGLPLVAGIWIPAYLLFAGLFQLALGSTIISGETIFNYLWALSFVMFFGLGYLLQSNPGKLSPASA